MVRNLYLLLAAMCCLFVQSAAAQITYVTMTGAGNMNGSSWANALPGNRLRGIMLTSPPTAPNAQIWLAAGTYKPHATSRDSSFYLAPSIKLYGGFAGTETQLSQRNWMANATVLSGDIGVANDSSDNSYSVVTFRLSDGALIDGCTISGGNANHLTNPFQRMGGGILNICEGLASYTSSPTLVNCRITRNASVASGAGMANYSAIGTTAPILINCTFDANVAQGAGGAIANIPAASTYAGIPPGNADLQLAHCSFINNRAGWQGGAVNAGYTGGGSNLSIVGCLFERNTSGYGGAICYSGSAPVPYGNPMTGTYQIFIDSCTFLQNAVTDDGLAIYLQSRYLNGGTCNILHSRFERNRSDMEYFGVVSSRHISSAHTRTNIIGCSFIANNNDSACYPVFSQAGFAQGGNPNGSGVDSLLISNTMFYKNGNGNDLLVRAEDGAKHYTTVANCTMYHDSAAWINSIQNEASVYGGSNVGTSTESSIEVQNSVLWHQLPSFLSTAQMEIRSIQTGVPASATRAKFTNCIITGVRATGWPADYGVNGGNNTGAYPGFLDTANGDLHLRCGAYGIDRGSNALINPAGTGKDVAGGARIYNGIVDIGAYETDPIALLPRAQPVISFAGRTMTYNYSLAADSVRWSFGDGSSANSPSGTHTYAANGNYTICLLVRNACGTDDSCVQKTITNADVNGVTRQALTLYPNPATSELTLTDVPEAGQVIICDAVGVRAASFAMTKGSAKTVPVHALPSGAYLIEFRAADGTRRAGRFIKR